MQNFDNPPLQIIINKTGEAMIWKGKSDFRDPAAHLMPFIDEFLKTFSGNELAIDFKQIEFMNSSTFRPIIHLLKCLNEREIKTTAVYNEKEHWQNISFKAFKTLAMTMKHVEVRGA